MKKFDVDYYETLDIPEENKPKEIQNIDLNRVNSSKPIEEKRKILPKPPLVYGHENFIQDCQVLVNEICRNEDDAYENKVEVLLILNDKGETRLHHINFEGEDEDNFFAIGSGSIFVNEFLDKFYEPNNVKNNLDYCMKLAMFCILYVQKYVKDFSVGIEEGVLPDNQVILNDGTFGKFTFNDEQAVLKELNDKVSKFIELQDDLKF
jgi:hypothetical protein